MQQQSFIFIYFTCFVFVEIGVFIIFKKLYKCIQSFLKFRYYNTKYTIQIRYFSNGKQKKLINYNCKTNEIVGSFNTVAF